MLVFDNFSREVVLEEVKNCACGLEEALKPCLENTFICCNAGALPLVGLGRELAISTPILLFRK